MMKRKSREGEEGEEGGGDRGWYGCLSDVYVCMFGLVDEFLNPRLLRTMIRGEYSIISQLRKESK